MTHAHLHDRNVVTVLDTNAGVAFNVEVRGGDRALEA